MESIFTKIIIITAALWLFFIIIYAYKNDFSSEIMSFFLPALGAILLSFFVGIKFIFFDVPKDREIYKCTVVILHDKHDNTLYGLGCDNLLLSKKNLNRPGLANLRTYNTDKLMIDGGLKAQLQMDPLDRKIDDHIQEKSEIFSKTITDFLEYNILDWLTEINKVNDSWLNKEYIYNFPNGNSEQAENIADSSMTKKVFLDKMIFPNNPLFNLIPIACNLPTGSKLISKQIGKFKRILTIDSYYSSLEITIQQIGAGSVNYSNTDILQKLDINNYDSVRNLSAINYQIEIKPKVKALYRFAKEAKLHPIWHDLLIEKFGEAYSYEEFKIRLQ